MDEQATKKLEEFAASLVRDAYNRGRTDLYGELCDELTTSGRTNAAGWILERYIAEMYATPNLSDEQLAMVEDWRDRLRTLRGKKTEEPNGN